LRPKEFPGGHLFQTFNFPEKRRFWKTPRYKTFPTRLTKITGGNLINPLFWEKFPKLTRLPRRKGLKIYRAFPLDKLLYDKRRLRV